MKINSVYHVETLSGHSLAPWTLNWALHPANSLPNLRDFCLPGNLGDACPWSGKGLSNSGGGGVLICIIRLSLLVPFRKMSRSYVPYGYDSSVNRKNFTLSTNLWLLSLLWQVVDFRLSVDDVKYFGRLEFGYFEVRSHWHGSTGLPGAQHYSYKYSAKRKVCLILNRSNNQYILLSSHLHGQWNSIHKSITVCGTTRPIYFIVKTQSV